MKHNIARLLLISMLVSLAACGGESGTPSDTTAADTTAAVTEPPLTDNLPERDMGGFELGIYIPKPESLGWALRAIDVTETNGEVLNDAIFERNRRVEERFNCKVFELQQQGTAVSGLSNAVLAGDNTYKLGVVSDNNVIALINAGVLTAWDDVPYIDLDADWWNQSASDTYTVSDKIYGTAGDFNLSEYSKAYMVYFNKDIYAEIEQDVSLYDLVLDGKWTLDRFTTIAKQYARDLNGDTKMDTNDQWGFVSVPKVGMQLLISGAGVRYIEPDENGDPYFTIAENKAYFDKMQTILNKFIGSEGWYHQNPDPMGGMYDDLFMEGKVMFQAASIWDTDKYREVEHDIGMLPSPKYDDNQKEYHCITAGGLISVLPKTLSAEELENVGIMLEALSFDSRQNVLPVYKETVLKGKYARDEESIEIIDIIFDAASFDAGVLLWYTVRENYMRGPFSTLNDTLASTTETIRSKLESAIQTTVDAVKE